MRTADILGYRVSAEGCSGDISTAWNLVRSGSKGNYVVCLNAHSAVVAQEDPAFHLALNESDILLPDGAGVVLAGKILNSPVPERVAGYEFFEAFSARAQVEGGIRYFFLGSTDHVLRGIVDRLKREYPDIEVCGTLSPPFKNDFLEEDNRSMVETINQARPDVLWVGMTAPKQEKWIHASRDSLNVGLVGAIGAVFDYYAGSTKRAPAWIRNLGLEWLARSLVARRLLKRNLRSIPIFIMMVLRAKIRRIVAAR